MPIHLDRTVTGAAPVALNLKYDQALPITAHRGEILEALARHPLIVVCGATGSGKSTQLPKLCLEAGRGAMRVIGHTQPRRLAARALANRLAEELATTVGSAVGYKVRFDDRTGPNTRIKLMTDGILLKELETDRTLRRYDTLIIDEAHERSLNIDLIFGVLKLLLPKRPDLKVVVTSATIDPGKFSSYFGGAPIIEVSGRSFPVEIRYRPLVGQDEDAAELSLPQGIVAAVQELDTSARGIRGDTLVFLPGEKQIRDAAQALERAALPHTQILCLFARLSAREQRRIFAAHGERRIVLATNVAETSLTVPGVRFVVDAGLARISRYSVRARVQRLPIERISKASAEQRRGRCGREAEGICIRLYSEEDFVEREDYTAPEVLRTNLASVILRMAVLGLGDPESFPFLESPDTRLVNDGVRLLQELQAMDGDRRVTRLGEQIASLPVDPRLGCMLLTAARQHCLTEMLVIAAFLEAQDPRERPADAQQQAAEKHASLADARSDFVTVLNLWRAYGEQAAGLSGSQLRKWCQQQFLSFMRMREWQDLHSQLSEAIAQLKLRQNQLPANYSELHRAVISGFLGSIGSLDERREYDGPRGMRFVVAPGTPLASKPPKWIVAGSLLETTRLYARMVAAVDSGWIEAAGAHLLKRSYTEPHWLQARGFVSAYETVTLYGLTLVSRRRVNYGGIAPLEAREIFIREALLAGHAEVRGEFLAANRQSQAALESLEAKIRRRDILVDEQAQVDFYKTRMPERISSVAAFESWRVRAERGDPKLLHMSPADLMRRDAPEADAHSFPDGLQVDGNRLPLRYRFEPSSADDGVTLIVPEPLLEVLDGEQVAWLVPGMQLEKVTALLRALPKAVRKELVPVPATAAAALAELAARRAPERPALHQWLAEFVARRTGAALLPAQFASLPLADHLHMNIRVVDAEDAVLAEGRDLLAIKRRLHGASAAIGRGIGTGMPVELRTWDFGELPEYEEVERNRLRLRVYPAVEDRGAGVVRIETRNAAEADAVSRLGLTRLAMLTLSQQVKYLHQRFADDRRLVLLGSGTPLSQPLAAALTWRSVRECFLADAAALPRTAQAFAALLDSRRSELGDVADRVAATVTDILTERRAVRADLDGLLSPAFAPARTDIETQLAMLLPAEFIESTPKPWFDHLPRYLQAIHRRLARLPGNAKRDLELSAKVAPFANAARTLLAQEPSARPRPELEQLRWMVEELRVSLYAQELKTVVRVSENRLAEQLERARAEASS